MEGKLIVIKLIVPFEKNIGLICFDGIPTFMVI